MDLIFSIGLLLGSIYLFFLVGAESPAASATELGASFWPRIILVLLMILVVVNIINYIKTAKAEGNSLVEGVDMIGFFKSKLFIGIIIVFAMALLLPYIGFIPSCFLFLMAYGMLLGDHKIPLAVIRSIILTLIIYAIFQGALDIMLARGTGVFRDFALFFEGILPF
ncbi:MAG: tripartite tricarboxylate transporter TctB family protein [Lachnospiraceae bacterium]|nr:tripartite tricarboxylate transporter TctB family protein [Lachnospiraceae bacterium]